MMLCPLLHCDLTLAVVPLPYYYDLTYPSGTATGLMIDSFFTQSIVFAWSAPHQASSHCMMKTLGVFKEMESTASKAAQPFGLTSAV
eukprot:114714-Pelagomonas_calceolata.AAC.2